MSADAVRANDVRAGVRVEVFTVIWMVIEAAVSLGAGIVAGSILLTAFGLASHTKPETSVVGIGIALAAVVIMPWLGITKRHITTRIDSDALRGDAAESFTCGYMGAMVLAGLVLTALFGWWWAEDVAALGFLVWLGRETWEAFEEAREGEG
jgi:divalent metal cation (Fe/Co/Zn/Cd) transporter